MNLGKIFSRNKNLLSLVLGVIFISYIYFDVPIPFINMLNNESVLVLSILFIILIALLFNHAHIITTLLAIVVMYEIFKKYKTTEESTSNVKTNNYYKKNDPDQVIDPTLKENITLEETIVQNMVPIVKHPPPHPTPRYQGITGDLSQSSPI